MGTRRVTSYCVLLDHKTFDWAGLYHVLRDRLEKLLLAACTAYRRRCLNHAMIFVYK